MKKNIPFRKDIIFKTNVFEITSISLEHTLGFEEENMVSGSFVVSGDYKITDTSINTEPFSYDLPFEIHLDDKYILDHANVDINDFYYEIINDNVLSVNIEVLIDHLEERLIPEPEIEKCIIPNEELVFTEDEIPIDDRSQSDIRESEIINEVSEMIEEPRCIEPEDKITSLFDSMDDTNETYQSYKVYIVRDGDTLELILEKYSITKEELEEYNDLKELKLGDKIIIPTHA